MSSRRIAARHDGHREGGIFMFLARLKGYSHQRRGAKSRETGSAFYTSRNRRSHAKASANASRITERPIKGSACRMVIFANVAPTMSVASPKAAQKQPATPASVAPGLTHE